MFCMKGKDLSGPSHICNSLAFKISINIYCGSGRLSLHETLRLLILNKIGNSFPAVVS